MNQAIVRKPSSFVGAAVAICLLAIMGFSANPAQAHTSVQSVSASSKVLKIYFTGPIRNGSVRVTTAKGKVVSKGRGGRDPQNITALRVPLKNVRSGTYTARWKMVAIDGHIQSGTTRFRVR